MSADSAQLAGNAMCRGEIWAERVLRRMPTQRAKPWPTYDASERVRAIAMRKISDLTGDDRLRERLARDCVSAAARRFGQPDRVIGAPAFTVGGRKR